jgi:hypothetical protein
MSKTKNLILLISLVIIGSFGAVWWFHHKLTSNPTAQDTLLVEISKAILQLVFVVVLGGLLKLFYDRVADQYQQKQKAREAERARLQAANDVRTAILNDLIEARNKIEEVRLRYRIEESEGPLNAYKSTILAILNARVHLARIYNAVITAKYLFKHEEKIAIRIRLMKAYLDELISEYDKEVKTVWTLGVEDQSLAIRGLTHFGEFLKDPETSRYGKDFLEVAYRPAVKEIRIEVLRANSVKNEDLDNAPDEPVRSAPGSSTERVAEREPSRLSTTPAS